MRTIWFCSALFALAAALYTGTATAQSISAVADLKNSAGQSVGTVSLAQTATGVRLTANAKGLAAGRHGFHIHAVGKCEGPDFASAGGHFNPESKQHGAKNPAGSHAGDLSNLAVAADGTGVLDATIARVSLASSVAGSLFDADGSALVIHQSEDDEQTDPTGNSGARIACGVIALSTLPAAGAELNSPGLLIAAVLLGVGTALLMSQRKRRD